MPANMGMEKGLYGEPENRKFVEFSVRCDC